MWQRVIVMEHHLILEGSLQSLFSPLAALDTERRCISFNLTQLVLLVSFHWTCVGVYASLN